MGRGLSPLQRYILTEAGKRARLYYADILEGYFKWKPVRPIRRYKAGEVLPGAMGFPSLTIGPEDDGGIKDLGSPKFSRQAIGEAVYSKTMATLSRSCLRLGERGLVTCLTGTRSHWSGVEITDAGHEWLSVNSSATLRQS